MSLLMYLAIASRLQISAKKDWKIVLVSCVDLVIFFYTSLYYLETPIKAFSYVTIS